MSGRPVPLKKTARGEMGLAMPNDKPGGRKEEPLKPSPPEKRLFITEPGGSRAIRQTEKKAGNASPACVSL